MAASIQKMNRVSLKTKDINHVNVAIIGAGNMAEEHIKAFSDIPGVAIVGVHSRTGIRAEKLARKYGIPQVFDSIEGLYFGTKADLAIVAVPELSANTVCKAVFRYPWISLIEKPVGYNLHDALDIAAEAIKNKRKAYVGLNRRHYSSTRAVIRELAGIKGRRVVNVLDQQNPLVALEGGQPMLVVKNWMYANSIHIIDYFPMFCRGKPILVNHEVKWNPENSYVVHASVNYSSGDIGIYQAIWNGPGPWAVTVTTQTKRWEMRPLEQAVSQVYKSRASEPIPLHTWDTQFKPGLRLQAEETIKVLRGETNCLPTLDDGITTMKLVKSIYEP